MLRTSSLCAGILLAAAPVLSQAFHGYESPLVHGVSISPDGTRLFVVNTADARLAVWSLLNPRDPTLLVEIPVGLEPVSVRAASADEAWVACSLADAVQVVSVPERRVVASLACKDEPMDIVFAGTRALVTCTTNREVVAFDRQTRARIGSLSVLGDEPRTLVTNANGTKAWVVVHRSGNRTTVVPPWLAPPQPPPTNTSLPTPPQVALIVDSENPTWKTTLNVDLPDIDVVEFDPQSLTQLRTFSAVGTILFGAALKPDGSELWVANTEARSLIRFEPVVRGHFVDNRLTRITLGASPVQTPIDLNPGFDYQTLPNPTALAIALAQPTDCAFTRDSSEVWVAAFGTDRLAAVDPATGAIKARLEIGTAPGTQIDPRRKKGPRSIAMHPLADLLYVANQLTRSVTIVDIPARQVVRELLPTYDPTPQAYREGRGFLYDAKLSGNGTNSCASCHVDGRTDGLCWDLGNPGGNMQIVKDPLGLQPDSNMHPMKGPMLTQTLQGLQGTDPFHWRGDRSKLQDFNGAFNSLMGGSTLAQVDLDAFAAFMLAIEYPGNPNQNLDHTLPTTPVGTSAAEGEFYFANTQFLPGVRCIGCHAGPSGASAALVPASFIGVSQDYNVPTLRNYYKRKGRIPDAQGKRTSGFGTMNDGHLDSVFALVSRSVFGSLTNNTIDKMKLENFITCFDTGTAPIVGYAAAPSVGAPNVPELDLMLLRAATLECEVVAKGLWDGEPRGLWYVPASGTFVADRALAATLTPAQVKAAVASGQARMLFMAVPPGAGKRCGIDRDLDGVLDGDAGLLRYGAGVGGCTPLVLDGNSVPRIGNDVFALTVMGQGPSNGIVMFGWAPANIPYLGITILMDPTGAVTLPLSYEPPALGTGFTRLPIPNLLSLRGQSGYLQAALLSSCAPPYGLASTNGLRLTIQ